MNAKGGCLLSAVVEETLPRPEPVRAVPSSVPSRMVTTCVSARRALIITGPPRMFQSPAQDSLDGWMGFGEANVTSSIRSKNGKA